MANYYLHFYDPWPGAQISRYCTSLSFECSPSITFEYCAIKQGHNISISILFCYKLDIKGPQHFAMVGETIGLEESSAHIEISHCQTAWFAVQWELHIRTGASQLLRERSQRRYGFIEIFCVGMWCWDPRTLSLYQTHNPGQKGLGHFPFPSFSFWRNSRVTDNSKLLCLGFSPHSNKFEVSALWKIFQTFLLVTPNTVQGREITWNCTDQM